MDRGAFRALREGCRNRGRKETDMVHNRQLTPAEKLIQRLMLESAGNLACASFTKEEAALLSDEDFVIENVFTGKRFVRTGLEMALRFMADRGFTNGDNPAHADWYLYPLNS